MQEPVDSVAIPPQLFNTKTIARFWRLVCKTEHTDCWIWGACRNKKGYGKFSVSKIPHVQMASHRLSWELTHGKIIGGLCVLHRCDNPSCVNPAHLFVGDKGDNARDAFAKGRRTVPDARKHYERLRAMTHCKRGHAYDKSNTFIKENGCRSCIACRRLRSNARYQARVNPANSHTPQHCCVR